jgi:hypothetical protein
VRHLLRATIRLIRSTPDERRGARLAALYEVPDDEGEARGGRRGPPGIPPEDALLFEKLVARMKWAIVNRDGGALLSMIVSGNIHKDANPRFQRVVAWVTETFAREGVETVNLDELFRARARAEAREPSFETDQHWNAVGHAWVAEALYARLKPSLGSPGRHASSGDAVVLSNPSAKSTSPDVSQAR